MLLLARLVLMTGASPSPDPGYMLMGPAAFAGCRTFYFKGMCLSSA